MLQNVQHLGGIDYSFAGIPVRVTRHEGGYTINVYHLAPNFKSFKTLYSDLSGGIAGALEEAKTQITKAI